MALTPSQAAQLTKDEKSLVAKMETLINEQLSIAYIGGYDQQIDVTVPFTMTPRVKHSLEAQFRDAGWDIQYHGHEGSRDPWYSLKATRICEVPADAAAYARRPDFS